MQPKNILDISFPDSTEQLDVNASGTITTQNLVPAGVATAGSAVEIDTSGKSTLLIQTVGTYTGALSPQGSLNGTDYVTIGGTPLIAEATGVASATIASGAQGIYQMDVAGYEKVRITALAALTGSVVVTERATVGGAIVSLGSPIPTGANTIGSVASITTSVVPGVAATNLGKAEDAVHASGDTGIFALGVRYEALTAPASAAGDYSLQTVDDLGKTVQMPYAPPINQVQGTTAAMTLVADTSVIAAPGASIRTYVTGLVVTNSHATVGTLVAIKDGSTVIDNIYVKALETVVVNYPTPKKLTANAVLNAANITTGSNTFVSAVGFKGL